MSESQVQEKVVKEGKKEPQEPCVACRGGYYIPNRELLERSGLIANRALLVGLVCISVLLLLLLSESPKFLRPLQVIGIAVFSSSAIISAAIAIVSGLDYLYWRLEQKKLRLFVSYDSQGKLHIHTEDESLAKGVIPKVFGRKDDGTPFNLPENARILELTFDSKAKKPSCIHGEPADWRLIGARQIIWADNPFLVGLQNGCNEIWLPLKEAFKLMELPALSDVWHSKQQAQEKVAGLVAAIEVVVYQIEQGKEDIARSPYARLLREYLTTVLEDMDVVLPPIKQSLREHYLKIWEETLAKVGITKKRSKAGV